MFLAGGALFYATGAAAAGSAGVGRYLLGQGLVTSVQLATQYANEFYDAATDRANPNRTWLTGGSGVLAEGRLPVVVAERAALAAASVAVVLAAVFVFVEPAVAAVGIVALLGGWYYSAPPARVSASGWGELEASVIVAVLTPVTGALVASGTVPVRLWWVVAALMPFHVAMLVVFGLGDRESDAAAGKRTLVVRLGDAAARWLVPGLYAVAAAVGLAAGAPAAWALAGGVTAVPVAAAVVAGSERWSWLATGAVAALTGAAVAALVALAVG